MTAGFQFHQENGNHRHEPWSGWHNRSSIGEPLAVPNPTHKSCTVFSHNYFLLPTRPSSAPMCRAAQSTAAVGEMVGIGSSAVAEIDLRFFSVPSFWVVGIGDRGAPVKQMAGRGRKPLIWTWVQSMLNEDNYNFIKRNAVILKMPQPYVLVLLLWSQFCQRVLCTD